MKGMRRLYAPMAVLLIYLMTPGSGELVSDVVHLVSSGHTPHAEEHADHEDGAPEHGCSGPFHVCSCHTTPHFVAQARSAAVPHPSGGPGHALFGSDVLHGGDFARGLFRPPIG